MGGRVARFLIVVMAGVACAACAKTTASAIPTGAGQFAPAPAAKRIDTYFKGQTPDRPYRDIGVVKGRYAAASAWGSAEVEDLLPELHAKARDIGADAIVIVSINRFLGPALNPFVRTIPNVEVVAAAIKYHAGPQPADARGGATAATVLSATQPPTSAGLSGTYQGEISGNSNGQSYTMRVTFTVVQNGDQFAGAWITSGGNSGTVTGTITESGVRNLQARQLNPCGGEFGGVAVIEAGGSRMRGSYVGNDCGGQVTASFVVTRQ